MTSRTHAQQAAEELIAMITPKFAREPIFCVGKELLEEMGTELVERHIAAALAEQAQARARYIVRCHLCNATWVDGEVSSEFIAAHDRRCPGEMLSKVEKALRELRALPAPPAKGRNR